jgi:hypothetical protein
LLTAVVIREGDGETPTYQFATPMSQLHHLTDDHSPLDQYEICVKGHLDQRWSNWFEGFAMVLKDNGETRLFGPVVDQAALYGLLTKVRDLGLPLISVVRIPPEQTEHSGIQTGEHP